MEEVSLYRPPLYSRFLPMILVVGIFCIFFSHLPAQTIRLVRTDVDSGRAGFITATQMFGVDVVLRGIKSCTGVSFELQYNNAQYVVYSNWKERQLGRIGAFAYDLSDTLTGNGSLHVGVLSGVPVPKKGIDDPITIHLDFVVRSNTPNNLPVSFNFVNAQAVSSTDSGGRIISLTPEVYNVIVHSFVNVFPGDADNNGIVDSRDATTIGAYLGQGSGISNVRGYRREPASTLWLPQRALIWDSAKATYADCDGSGDITLSDNLVVNINLSRKHSIIKPPGGDGGIPILTPQEFPATALRVPLTVYSNRNHLLAVACALRSTSALRILGFEPSAEYTSTTRTWLFKYDEPSRTAYLHFGSNTTEDVIANGVIGHIVFEEGGVPSFRVTESFGAQSSGAIFPLGITTSVQDEIRDDVQISPNPAQNRLLLHSIKNETLRLSIYNLLGDVQLYADIENGLTSLDISPLASGQYVVVLQSKNSLRSYPLSVLR